MCEAIIQAGIKEVIYMSDKYADSESTMASKKMFEMAGVKYTNTRISTRRLNLNYKDLTGGNYDRSKDKKCKYDISGII